MMNEQVVSIHFQIKNMDLITAKTLIIIYHFLNLIGMINCFHFVYYYSIFYYNFEILKFLSSCSDYMLVI